MRRNKLSGLVIAALSLLLSSVIVRYFTVGFAFTALVFAGAAGLFALFALIELMGQRHPEYARKYRQVLWILICIGSVIFSEALWQVVSAARTDEEPAADYLIVLGAKVNGTAPSMALSDRLEAAFTYLQEYPNSIAVVSGGQGPDEQISEAEAMRIWLENRGIGSDRIVTEDQSTSTLENVGYSLRIIEELGGGSVAVLTSEYHVYRAKAYAKSFSMDAVGIAARTSNRLLAINYFIREACGVIYMRIFH